MKKLKVLLLPVFLLIGCATTDTADRTSDIQTFEREADLPSIEPALSMLDHLKRVSGLNIDQRGGEISVFLRGVTTLAGENRALFVVDGTPIGNRYNDLENSVNVTDVAAIQVLRGSQASQLYGSRAAFGAVLVSTK